MPQTNSVCKIIMIPEHKMKPLTKNNSIQQYFSNPIIQHDLNTIDDYLDVECVLNYFILLYFAIG